MEHLEFIKKFILICLVFVPLEFLLPGRSEQKRFRRGLVTDLLHYSIGGFLLQIGQIALFLLLLSFLKSLVPVSLHTAIVAQPVWVQFLEVLLIADIGFYLVHRMFHTVPWLWKFHSIHHSIEEMDFIAAHRVHPVDQILTRSATLLPVFALDFSPAAILMFVTLYHWQSLLIHSNVRIKFGPLRWLLATPEFHHWHHANQPEAIDKNFAGQLPFLDVLFGTLYMPKGKVPEKYGIDQPVPSSYIGQLTHPFRRAVSGP